MDEQPAEDEVRAAGAVVFRWRDERTEVLVVHRPRHDDWSLPKGKLDTGETFEAAAVREVREETGVTIRLREQLRPTRYRDRRDRPKIVRWWLAEVEDIDVREPDDEVDEIRWVAIEDAPSLLTYEEDLGLVSQALAITAT